MSNLDNEPHLPHFLTPPVIKYKKKRICWQFQRSILLNFNICNFYTLVYFLLITNTVLVRA